MKWPWGHAVLEYYPLQYAHQNKRIETQISYQSIPEYFFSYNPLKLGIFLRLEQDRVKSLTKPM
jgi:hypothetical protein